jgi:tRNA threonylcarbamoyladenosine biosynthesis protein TsaE
MDPIIDKHFKLHELPEIASNIFELISNHPTTDSAVVIALYGDLGAGKTTLTQHIATLFGIDESVTSPTFTIMKSYIIPLVKSALPHKNLIHIDAYRLEHINELIHLDWEKIKNNKHNIIIIEWPEKIAHLIPNHAIKINLSHIDQDTRKVYIEKMV